MSDFPKVEIEVGPAGTGRIVVDGKDLSSSITGFTLRVRGGQTTTLFVQMAADVVAKAETEIVEIAPISGRIRYEKKP